MTIGVIFVITGVLTTVYACFAYFDVKEVQVSEQTAYILSESTSHDTDEFAKATSLSVDEKEGEEMGEQ